VSWSGLSGLNGVATPDIVPARRLPRLARWRTEDMSQRARYDTRTLFYGAVWFEDRRLLRVFAPKPLNLAAVLRSARWCADGAPLPRPRLRRFKRYATLDFPASEPVQRLAVVAVGWQASVVVEHPQPERFAGCNVLYTMSQDNDLDWICDWVTYHHRAHGADAVVISDNRSTAYTPEVLRARLVALGVLKAVLVQSVPFPYGPSAKLCSRASSGRFLQSAVANYVRDAWLSKASAVLSCDVDELVISESGKSVFDAARSARLGVVTFPGYWRFCDPSLGQPRHGDHVFRSADRAKACPNKYAYCPDGPLGRWSLMTHSLEALPRQWLSGAPEFWFAHCYGISTGWKVGRETLDSGLSLQIVSDMQKHMSKAGLQPSS